MLKIDKKCESFLSLLYALSAHLYKYPILSLFLLSSMEPQDVRRECWTVALGNAHSQEERMVGAGYAYFQPFSSFERHLVLSLGTISDAHW